MQRMMWNTLCLLMIVNISYAMYNGGDDDIPPCCQVGADAAITKSIQNMVLELEHSSSTYTVMSLDALAGQQQIVLGLRIPHLKNRTFRVSVEGPKANQVSILVHAMEGFSALFFNGQNTMGPGNYLQFVYNGSNVADRLDLTINNLSHEKIKFTIRLQKI